MYVMWWCLLPLFVRSLNILYRTLVNIIFNAFFNVQIQYACIRLTKSNSKILSLDNFHINCAVFIVHAKNAYREFVNCCEIIELCVIA